VLAWLGVSAGVVVSAVLRVWVAVRVLVSLGVVVSAGARRYVDVRVGVSVGVVVSVAARWYVVVRVGASVAVTVSSTLRVWGVEPPLPLLRRRSSPIGSLLDREDAQDAPVVGSTGHVCDFEAFAFAEYVVADFLTIQWKNVPEGD
jgi:hypothetical protein